jgi:hypothetical protein
MVTASPAHHHGRNRKWKLYTADGSRYRIQILYLPEVKAGAHNDLGKKVQCKTVTSEIKYYLSKINIHQYYLPI